MVGLDLLAEAVDVGLEGVGGGRREAAGTASGQHAATPHGVAGATGRPSLTRAASGRAPCQ